MKNDEQKDKVQQEALKAWLHAKKKGSAEIITGLGKTFISLHALYTMPRNDDIHLFAAEQTDRKKDLLDDIAKYNKIFNRNVLKDYNLQFACYQTIYRWKNRKFGLVIADEIHDSLSPAYSQFYFNNRYRAIIGLSATLKNNITYNLENDEIITKKELLNKVAPVCYTYTVDDGQADGTSRELDVYIIKHKLDNVVNSIKAGNAKKRFFQTEYAAYTYWDKEHKRSWFINDEELKQLKIRITSHKRSTILYNLESKINVVKKILSKLTTKTIIFGNSIDSLTKITPNVVSSKNSNEVNERIRDAFEKDKIKIIGSFKKLKQGANLSGLDNCIIMSYYSTDKDLIQRIGRLRNNGEVGNVFILVTIGTQEEVWLNKMFESINNLNIIHCEDVDECLNYLKK
tara:strand:- start:39876 stop:41075 length:1200 start_codon:yes stop_codon:yes gene_type:complete